MVPAVSVPVSGDRREHRRSPEFRVLPRLENERDGALAECIGGLPHVGPNRSGGRVRLMAQEVRVPVHLEERRDERGIVSGTERDVDASRLKVPVGVTECDDT